jgi:predicted nucleotide-binding protein (sugar kinase/HSP70/actin superfamily)
MFAEGMRRQVVETCLPIKAFVAHVEWLENHGKIDFLFIPSVVTIGKDRHGRDTHHCPYLQSLVQFAKQGLRTPLLNPVINWKWHPDDERREMLKLARPFGVSKKDAQKAWKIARDAEEIFKRKLKEIGDGVIKKLASGELDRAFVVTGKDYNIFDNMLNSGAVSILEGLGETVISQDMLTDNSGDYPSSYECMIWTHGKEIISAVHLASKTGGLYPVMITSFGCGPDSFTTKFAKDAARGKPFLTLEVDEHSSTVGMETRIEAFLDSLPKKNAIAAIPERKPFAVDRPIKRIFLTNFSDHGYAFAATMKTLGFTPVLTNLPDEESESLGSLHSTYGECHPYTLMLGGYLKAAKSDDDFSDACYFMPDSGLCRVGQFGMHMRLVAEKEKLTLPVLTKIEDLFPFSRKTSSATKLEAVIIYWEMMRGMDLLMQKHLETRAYEVVLGAADKAHDAGKKSMMDFIMRGRPHEGLKSAVAHLNAVKVDRSAKKIGIGITGDYYTRVCDFANGDIFRDIEKMGGIVMLPPTMSEFVKYDSHQKPIWAFNHRNAVEFFQSVISKPVIARRERKIREIFGKGLSYEVPLDYKRGMEYIKPYMDKKLPSGLTGSVAAIMEQIAAGADGILNIITFHCTYGLVLGSVLAKIDADYPKIPKLTLIYEGLKPTHNKLRLEAFMDRIKNNKETIP